MSTPSRSARQGTACLFLRLEGPFQSWGGRTIGRFRRTESVPTKSGVIGLIGAAMGLGRKALNARLRELNGLQMAVRVDRSGTMHEDYHTVGARIGVLAADGNVKKTAGTGEFEPVVSHREYLIDASFLVILSGTLPLIEEVAAALQQPRWPLFLGRKRCLPGTPVFAGVSTDLTLPDALRGDGPEDQSLLPPDAGPSVRVVTDLLDLPTWRGLVGLAEEQAEAQYDHAKAYVTDRLMHLEPPVHAGRIVLDFEMPRPATQLPRPDLTDPSFGVRGPAKPQRASDPQARKAAREKSQGRCIFCRFEPADPKQLHAHHLTYVRRGRERVDADSLEIGDDDFVMLCSECHAAVTMLEYQAGFGLNRIDPREPRWRRRILEAREARRHCANPAMPEIATAPVPRDDVHAKLPVLFESTIPLKAGSSFPPDAPGNRWLANRQRVHQRLSMAFPSAGGKFAAAGYGVTRDEGGFLFRIEEGPRACVLVRSRILPDWGRAFGDAGWIVDRQLPPPRPLDPGELVEGSTLTFELEANPVKRLNADGPQGRKGARVPLREEGELRNWLLRREQNGGFEVQKDGLEIRRLGRRTARLRSAADRHWDAVRYSGLLKVTDAESFARTLAAGIGPAKAFGFGLLSISEG